MRISDWSSDVCSSDLSARRAAAAGKGADALRLHDKEAADENGAHLQDHRFHREQGGRFSGPAYPALTGNRPDHRHHKDKRQRDRGRLHRSEEHTSELQSLMRTSYAVFCLKKKINNSNYEYRNLS